MACGIAKLLVLTLVIAHCSAQNSSTASVTSPTPTSSVLSPTSTGSVSPSATTFSYPTTTPSSSSGTSSAYKEEFPVLTIRSDHDKEIEYEGYDGWYNNRAHPEWGAVDMPLTRRTPSHYSDGVYEPSGSDRPNPLTLSQKLMSGDTGEGSSQMKNALLVFFGQQVVEEILDAQRPGCPPEYFNIEIPDDYALYKDAGTPPVIPLLRSRYDMRTGYSPNNPRQQLNEITPWIDGGLMYGVAKAWADALRSFKDGKLAKSEKGDWPQENDIGLPMANPPPPSYHKLLDAKRFFKLGNPRGNENPFLLTFGILWFRYHNVIAERIKQKTNITDDEKLFNEARKWVIATHQKIVYYDWLPRFLGVNVAEFRNRDVYKYKPSVHPGIAHVFQSAAMRFGHTMVTPGVMRRLAGTCTALRTTSASSALGEQAANKSGVRTCNSFWNPQIPIQEEGSDGKPLDIEAFLRGMVAQTAEREDNIITEDLRGFVFGSLDFSRRDLMAVNIQRGRDHGLPDYNTARRAYNLEPKTAFKDIRANDSHINQTIFEALEEVHGGNINNIDVWVGGLLETSKQGPGELFSAIIDDQFRRIRDGDRFWYENLENGLFTKEEIESINNITLYDVILMSTNLTEDDLPENGDVFYVGNCSLGTLSQYNMDNCTEPKTFDYFDGSEVSYALTFLFIGLFCVGVVVLMFFLAHRRQKILAEKRKINRKNTQRNSKPAENEFIAAEWRRNLPDRTVRVKLGPGNIIRVSSDRGQLLRTIDLRGMEWIIIFIQSDREQNMLSARMDREYDMIVKFDSQSQREQFLERLETFLGGLNINCRKNEMKTQMLISSAHTKEDRQKRLEKFFRVAFAHAFDIEYQDQDFNERMGEAKEVLSCELSRTEFAEALSLKPNSLFVEQMFDLVDKDRNGYLSFREFLDVIIIFAKGTPDEKLRLFFDMYDVSGNDKLGREEFKQMIKSFMELVNADVESDQLDTLTNSMFSEAGFQNKDELTFEDFKRVMGPHMDSLADAQLNLSGTGVDVPKGVPAEKKVKKTMIKRENVPTRARKTLMRTLSATPRSPSRNPTARVKIATKKTKDSDNFIVKHWIIVARYVSNHISDIFITVLYTLVLFAIFAERAYYYSVEREHAGLRRIAGYGVTVTRGAASAMMFTYSSLLVTMCRNLITFLRETFVGHYIPFDSNVLFHKYIAFWALVFTVMHCIGHAINFYHVATQPANDLTCLFRNYFHRSHELPKFHYWCWETITGLTGVFLVLVVAIMYVFATQYSRRHVFTSFWLTHQLYVVLYLLMVLHGSGNLVQRPFFHYFFLGPGILFALDKLVSMSRKKANIAVMKAELLPSDITFLEFKRPVNFEYKAGQWCRIACVSLGGGEYHPFTLTSAPHEDNLGLHIRAVGPWTINLRQVYDPANLQRQPYPQLYLDGPFGEGHQDWYRYEVSVLVGGGIGVTPFASILKDIAHKGSLNSTFACKKVYFIWVTRTQKHFEWLTDIIREVEEKDKSDLVSVHIFITQFYHKFDLRTTMLYICERHFQKFSGKSLFTGLRSITHFGRPDFRSFLESLSTTIHPETSKIGVFSCGPPAMTRSVESACATLNKTEGAAFIHHFENF